MLQKLRELRETNALELDQEETEPTIGQNFKIKFEIPNGYSENILITDSDYLVRQKKRDLHNGRHELQIEIRSRLQERVSERGVSI